MKKCLLFGVIAVCAIAFQTTESRAQEPPPSTQWTPEQIANYIKQVDEAP